MYIPENANITKKTLMYVCIEDEESKKYVTRTGYSYLMYLSLLLLVVGTMLRRIFFAQPLLLVLFTALCILGIAGLVTQLVLNNFLMKDVKEEVRSASQKGLVTVSGDKLSFKNPLTVTIKKVDPSDFASDFAKRTLIEVPEDDEDESEDDEDYDNEDDSDKEEAGDVEGEKPEDSAKEKE